MRKAFISTLIELAEDNPQILLLTGDVGYTVLEPFLERFSNRFFNLGVAEQNMVGVATGLAEAGFIPYLYSIAPFASLRPYEFIRNGPLLHKLPVRIVGIGGGFEYGINGLTHFGLEDIGVMRIQPRMTVVIPADCEQTRNALKATWDLPGPVYYRIGKDDKIIIPGLDGRFNLEHVQQISEGDNLLFITMGSIASEVVEATEVLATQNISCSVVVVSAFNPAPIVDLVKILSKFRIALTVEAHYTVGGLGSLVSEIVAERGIKCRIVRVGMKYMPDGFSGSQNYLYRRYGLSSKMLAKTALRVYQEH